ncbi:PEPxxWA-CTERM sorting domain-containing protein [Sandarakinorhabdus sp.]|uniref:PEPxxWA-CTERM sorting domain-containing protein n=1 Tax=Sandarakinorhabdus sp. TaxID=1916663 RepID=UPI003342D166
MSKFLITLLATSVVAAAPAAADPCAVTTVTFPTYAPVQCYDEENCPPAVVSNPYDEAGFHFQNSAEGGYALVNGSSNPTNSADPTGGVLTNNYGYKTTTVTKVDGGLFDFISVDLADGFNNMNYFPATGFNRQGGDVLFTFTTGSGSTTQTITIDGIPGLQTFTFNMTGLTSVSYLPQTTFNGYIQADNFVVSAATGAVPEPASWAMLIAGFGLTGAAMRRRRTAVAA